MKSPTHPVVPRKRETASARLAKNLIKDKDGNVLAVNDLKTALYYTDMLAQDTSQYSGGYRKYITKNGPSTFSFICKLVNQGLIKTALACLRVLCDRTADGDNEAHGGLNAITAYIPAQTRKSGDAAILRKRHEIEALQGMSGRKAS